MDKLCSVHIAWSQIPPYFPVICSCDPQEARGKVMGDESHRDLEGRCLVQLVPCWRRRSSARGVPARVSTSTCTNGLLFAPDQMTHDWQSKEELDE